MADLQPINNSILDSLEPIQIEEEDDESLKEYLDSLPECSDEDCGQKTDPDRDGFTCNCCNEPYCQRHVKSAKAEDYKAIYLEYDWDDATFCRHCCDVLKSECESATQEDRERNEAAFYKDKKAFEEWEANRAARSEKFRQQAKNRKRKRDNNDKYNR